MASWDDHDTFGFSIWCDKTVVLDGLSALRGESVTPSGLLDAIALIDAFVWFDAIVVDATLEVDWPPLLADAVATRPFNAEELAALQDSLISIWNDPNTNERVQDFWRQLFAKPRFSLRLSDADRLIDSSRFPEEFARSVDSKDWWDLLKPDRTSARYRRQLAAFSTARAFSGGAAAANLGMFHMPAAVRRGLLGSFHVPCQASDLITIEPVRADSRFPSAFGRVATVALEEPCGLWEAASRVRDEHQAVRRGLRRALTDPRRIRPAMERHKLGLDRPEWQVSLGLNIAVVSGGLTRALTRRRVALVNRLGDAADTLREAADDLCHLAGIERPIIDGALDDLAEVAQRLHTRRRED